MALPVALAVLIAIAAVAATLALNGVEEDRVRELRGQRLDRAAMTVRETFRQPLEQLEQVAAGVRVGEPITPGDFDALAEPVLRHPEVSALGLEDRVAPDERAAWERRYGIEIMDRGAGPAVRSPRRFVHFPVRAVAAQEPTPPGTDLAASAPRARIIERALVTGEVTLTEPVPLLVGDKAGKGVVAFHPAGRRAIVSMLLTFDRLAEGLRQSLPPGTALTIADGPITLVGIGDPAGGVERDIDFGGRTWTVRLRVATAEGTIGDEIVLIVGLLIAVAAGRLLAESRRRERTIAAEIDERLAERDAATAEAGHARDFSSTLLAAMPDAFAAEDRTGLIVVNDALCELTGFDREELLGRRFPFGFWPEESLSEARRLRDRLDEHGSAQMQLTLRTKNGDRVPVLVSAGTVSGSDGPVRISVITDIRERAAAQRALEESEARLQQMADAAADVVLRLSLTERIEWASPSAATVLGLSPEGLVGRRFADLFEGEGSGALSDRPSVRRLRRADGTEVWTETTVTATHDDLGTVTGMRASVRDVTELLAREA